MRRTASSSIGFAGVLLALSLASPVVQANCSPAIGGALSLSSPSASSAGPSAQDPAPQSVPDAPPVDAMSEARQALAAIGRSGGCGHGVGAGGGRRGAVRTRSGQAGRLCLLQPGGGAGGEGRVPREHACGEQGAARGAADRQRGFARQGVPGPGDRVQLRRPAGARRTVRDAVAEVPRGRPDPGERPGQEGARRRAHAAEAFCRGDRLLRPGPRPRARTASARWWMPRWPMR